MPTRDPDSVIDHFVALVLSHIDREFPNKLDHVINGPEELKSPRELHPVFYGSFDWHSCVHGHWLLVRALRNYPGLAQAAELRTLLDGRFTDAAVAAEVEYLSHKRRETFERTYGWAWLLKLGAELVTPPLSSPLSAETAAAFKRWSQTLAPLMEAFANRFLTYLPKATYPIRVGTHQNTAFALTLAIDYARAMKHQALEDRIIERARTWYLKDRDYPAWEPDGTDFLSPGLCEAECMRRALPESEFRPWLNAFFPKLAEGEPATLFKPAFVSDRTDGQITHLDGLNLSRAWCWRSLASTMAASDPRKSRAEGAFKVHVDAALPHVSGDYMGEHWLATFALLALTE